MTTLFANPLIFLAAAVLLSVETAALLIYRRYYRRGIAPLSLIANTGAGGCLLIAAWLASTAAPLSLVCVAMGVSFLFHLLDQLSRWHS